MLQRYDADEPLALLRAEGGAPPEKAGSLVDTPFNEDRAAHASSVGASDGSTRGGGGGDGPLRIHFDFSALDEDGDESCRGYEQMVRLSDLSHRGCRHDDILTPEKRSILTNDLLPAAAAQLSRLLRVARVRDKLRLSSFTCGYDGGVHVPMWMHLHGVPDADIVIFVSARPIGASGATGSTIAYAGYCESDQFGRPTAAHFNWDPSHLRAPRDRTEREYYEKVAMHELTHALAFSQQVTGPAQGCKSRCSSRACVVHVSQLLDRFPHQPAARLRRTPYGTWARTIVSPSVARTARDHFGCDELEGA